MKSTIVLCEFITKIIFISKHFNYNIHFLNIVSVRWCPLLSTHSRKRFWKFCFTRCSVLREIADTSSLTFCFKSTVVLGFFSYTLLLKYPQRKKYCDDTQLPLACHWDLPQCIASVCLEHLNDTTASCRNGRGIGPDVSSNMQLLP